MSTPRFIFAKKDIRISDSVSVEKSDVGIIKSESEENTLVFFIRIWQNVDLNKNDFEIFDTQKTGDGFPQKICNICHKLLNTTEFARNQNAINNRPVRRPSCQECRKRLEGTNPTPKEKLNWPSFRAPLSEFFYKKNHPPV